MHSFAIDNVERGVFSRVLRGAGTNLQVGIISVLSPYLIGTVRSGAP